MLLVFDVGNTNMVLGLYKGKELIKYWRITTDKYKTSDEYGILISNLSVSYTHLTLPTIA